MKQALVSAAHGQIGSFISEILLAEGYFVWGLKRRCSLLSEDFQQNLLRHPRFEFVEGDITDTKFIGYFLSQQNIDLFINCAAQSNSQIALLEPQKTIEINGHSVARCLEMIKIHSPTTRFITLGSSECFRPSSLAKNEQSPLVATSPYAEGKLIAHQVVIQYRQAGLFACNAICFNSESSRRSEIYVSRKITKAVARIKLGLQSKLALGDIASGRDFSHAYDVARAIYGIVSASQPDDFVVCSGQIHLVQDWLEVAFNRIGLDWKKYIDFDQKLTRSNDQNCHLGDNTKIKSKLYWQATYPFEKMVNEMVDYDIIESKKV